jgi:hypothetical protein
MQKERLKNTNAKDSVMPLMNKSGEVEINVTFRLPLPLAERLTQRGMKLAPIARKATIEHIEARYPAVVGSGGS